MRPVGLLRRLAALFVLHPVSGSAGEFEEDSYRFDGLNDAHPPELRLCFGGNVGP